MTNKPMLSVELRAGLERLLKNGYAQYLTKIDAAELRALLDKEVDGNSHSPKGQGEPVAYRYKELQPAWEIQMPWELASVPLGLVYLERKAVAQRGDMTGSAHYLGMKIEPLYVEQAAPVAVSIPDVDELAQIIRKVDGSHALGAGSLAEAILEELAKLN